MTVISSILTAPLRMISPHQNSFKHSESAQPTPVTVRPPPPPVTPPPLSIFHNFSSIISSAKIVFHIEGLAISLSHFRWWYQGQSEISLPPSLSMFFRGWNITYLKEHSLTVSQSVSQSVFVNPFWEKYLILPCGSIRSLRNPIRTILSSTTLTQEHKDRSGLERFRALSKTWSPGH